jgi:hypothetical protein
MLTTVEMHQQFLDVLQQRERDLKNCIQILLRHLGFALHIKNGELKIFREDWLEIKLVDGNVIISGPVHSSAEVMHRLLTEVPSSCYKILCSTSHHAFVQS